MDQTHTQTTLVIGATGHRVLTDVDLLEAGIECALELIVLAYPGRTLEVLSPLAEGADSLIASIILRRANARLRAVLPFQASDYVLGFTTDMSKSEFEQLLARAYDVECLPPVAGRSEAFEEAGNYVVDHSDVLIALWDGLQEQGRGGTAGVVARARDQAKPVLIVRAGNRKPGTLEPTSLGSEHGQVIAERLPDS